MTVETISVELPLLDTSELSTFRARLINKGKKLDEKEIGRERRDFIERVCAPRGEFTKWFSNRFRPRVETEVIACTIPTGEFRLSEGEIAGPPPSAEKSLAEMVGDIPPRQAALPALWASYNLELLQRGVVEEPCHFAKPVGSGPKTTGRATLERALQKKSEKQEKELDACIRTLCRQMLGGVPEERGQISVYIDPRIARAWWRGRVIRQTVEELDIDPDSAWDTLREPGPPWEELVQHVVRKLTHVGERTIRSALVARFVEMKLTDDDSTTRRKRTAALLRETGRRVAGRSLGVLSAREVLDVLREIEV